MIIPSLSQSIDLLTRLKHNKDVFAHADNVYALCLSSIAAFQVGRLTIDNVITDDYVMPTMSWYFPCPVISDDVTMLYLCTVESALTISTH